MLLDYQKIWDEKGYAKDGHTLELVFKHVRDTARKNKIDTEIADMAFREIMQENEDYPLICPCGCGIDKSGTAINHAMLTRMFKINKTVEKTKVDFLQDRHNGSIISHMQEDNRKYEEESRTPKWYHKLFRTYEPIHLM